MSVTYKWSFPRLEAAVEHEGQTDVVQTVHWRLLATDDDLSAETYGTASIPFDPEAEFHSADDLLFDVVQGWVEAAIDAEALKAGLAKQIDEKRAPTTTIITPAWGDDG